jgi:hypothetical protein
MKRKRLLNGMSTDTKTIHNDYDELVAKYKQAYEENPKTFFFNYLTTTQQAILFFLYIKGEINNISKELGWVSQTYAHNHKLIQIFRDLKIIDAEKNKRTMKLKLNKNFRGVMENFLK